MPPSPPQPRAPPNTPERLQFRPYRAAQHPLQPQDPPNTPEHPYFRAPGAAIRGHPYSTHNTRSKREHPESHRRPNFVLRAVKHRFSQITITIPDPVRRLGSDSRRSVDAPSPEDIRGREVQVVVLKDNKKGEKESLKGDKKEVLQVDDGNGKRSAGLRSGERKRLFLDAVVIIS